MDGPLSNFGFLDVIHADTLSLCEFCQQSVGLLREVVLEVGSSPIAVKNKQ